MGLISKGSLHAYPALCIREVEFLSKMYTSLIGDFTELEVVVQ
jgi:hypothetical protein